ncbi:MAG TPA: hypothetical protein VHT28_12135 [Silvibacterium sp.]|nr:hypothetical protein [Silvibacterium sp.]
MLEKTARTRMFGQHVLDYASQCLIAAAHFIEQSITLGWIHIQRGQENLLRLLSSRIHVHQSSKTMG